MGGPGNISSDILGIEIGRRGVRGVRCVRRVRVGTESFELVAAAECGFDHDVVAADGVIDPSVFDTKLEELLYKLEVRDRSQVRVGLTIGPRNSGVGSGPAMPGWLQAQAVDLREPMLCAGELGLAFLPSRAVEAVSKLATGVGIDLVRVDLAPVAAARSIGQQVDDVIRIGSGQGWQSRMRDFEVLEAMENSGIGCDDPLAIVSADGSSRTIDRFGWIELGAGFAQSLQIPIEQLAPAVGVAIGVAYDSPGNLLNGEAVDCAIPDEAAPSTPAEPEHGKLGHLDHLAGYELTGDGAEATLQLQQKASAPDVSEGEAARRTTRTSPATSLSPLRKRAQSAPVSRAVSTEAGDGWGDSVDESDPITMFSPDIEVEQMMGKRDRRLSIDIFVGLVIVSAILLALAYFLL